MKTSRSKTSAAEMMKNVFGCPKELKVFLKVLEVTAKFNEELYNQTGWKYLLDENKKLREVYKHYLKLSKNIKSVERYRLFSKDHPKRWKSPFKKDFCNE